MPKIPNLFIIGAPESGTTALAVQLSAHKDIYVGQKEPRYFDALTFYDYEDDYQYKTLSSYLSLYSTAISARSKYSMDASVFNMYSEISIRNVLNLSPNAKFILVLRDPLSASKSMHLENLKYANTAIREISSDFDVCWNALNDRRQGKGYPKGCRNKFIFRYDLLYSYEKYIPFINKLINRDNLIVIDYSVYRNNPKSVHQSILEFLDVDVVDLPLSENNLSYVAEPCLTNKIINWSVRSSFGFRSKLHLIGDNVSFLKKLAESLIRKKTVKKQASVLDAEIQKYFTLSYVAMQETCAQYSVNQNPI